MRILVVEPLAAEGLELLRAHHEVDERLGLERTEIAALLPDYDALVVRSQVQVDAELIAAGTRLVVVGRAGVGVDNVDLEAATRAGITVVNAPTGNTIAAAEHTLALLYGLARRMAPADASMRRGEWKRSQFTGVELRGKTLGIVGLGKIGQAIAVRARAMEMAVLGADPFVTPEQAANVGVELVSFDDLVERVGRDHRPRADDPGDAGLIDKAAIERMKPGACCSTSRAAGSSTSRPSPTPSRRPARRGRRSTCSSTSRRPGRRCSMRPNTLLTPHLGASTAEAQVAVAEEVAEQVLDVLDGRPARYAVNAPLLTPETAQAIAPYLPLAETLGRFLAQFARPAPRTLTVEIAGEPAAYDASPLVAAVLRGLLETVDDGAGQPRQRGDAGPGPRDQGGRAQDPDAGAVLVAADAVRGGRAADGDGRRHRRRRRAADRPAERATDSTWPRRTSMLITRHRDRPGTIGRIGALLGEADVNISAMHPRALRAARGRPMVLALDDDVPAGGRGDPGRRGGHRRLDDPPRRRAVTGGSAAKSGDAAAHPRGPRRDARPAPPRRVGVHRRGPLPGPGRDAALRTGPPPGGARRRAARRARTPRRPCPSRAARRSRSSTRRSARAAETAAPIAGGDRPPASTGDSASRARPDPGFWRSAQGDWEGAPPRRDRRALGRELLRAWRRRPPEAWAPGGESLAEVAGAGRGRPRRRCSSGSAAAARAGSARPPQVGGYRGAGPTDAAVVDPRRPRRGVQGRPAHAVRHPARAGSGRSRSPCAGSPWWSSAAGGRSSGRTT